MLGMSLPPLGFQRETMIIAALAALIIAGVIVSMGAWILFRRERRSQRRPS
jgi:hypothetical protein